MEQGTKAVEKPVEIVLKNPQDRTIVHVASGTLLVCFKCGHRWKTRRTQLPARCAGCQSTLWFVRTADDRAHAQKGQVSE